MGSIASLATAITLAASANPADWGGPEIVTERLGSAFTEVASARRPFSWDFPTVTVALDYFLTASPVQAARSRHSHPTSEAASVTN